MGVLSVFIIVIDAVAYPAKWGPPDPYDPYRRPPLSRDSSEYKEVEKNVMKTAGSSLKQVIKVCA